MEKLADQSNQAEIARLQNAVASLGDRIALIEPAPKVVKPDAKAEKAARAERENQEAALLSRLDELRAMAANLDTFIGQVVELQRGLGVAALDVATVFQPLIAKEQRRPLTALAGSLPAMVGSRIAILSRRREEDGLPRQPAIGESVSTLAEMIRVRLPGAADPVDELLK